MKYLQKVTLEQFGYLKENPLDNKFFFPSILILFEIDDIMSGNLPDEVVKFVEKSGIKTPFWKAIGLVLTSNYTLF